MKTRTLVAACFTGVVLFLACTASIAQGSSDNGSMPPPPPGQGGGPHPPKFEDFDANSDGCVTLEEFTAATTKMSTEFFARMDADSDGSLSKDELSKCGGPGRGPRPEGKSEAGDRPAGPPPGGARGAGARPPRPEDCDANADGTVTKDEFLAAWNKSTKERFTKQDTNGDGKLTSDEFSMGRGPRR